MSFSETWPDPRFAGGAYKTYTDADHNSSSTIHPYFHIFQDHGHIVKTRDSTSYADFLLPNLSVI